MSTTVSAAHGAEQGAEQGPAPEEVCCDGCSLPEHACGPLDAYVVHYQNGTTGPARYCTGCAMIAEECPGWLAEATEIASITRVDGDAAHAGDATDEAC